MIDRRSSSGLEGRRVLVLEDDFYTATDLAKEISRRGGSVVGPFRDVAESLVAVATAAPDGALVDVNLGDGPDFALAQRLRDENVPFIFVTGYDAGSIPTEFAEVPRIDKPADIRRVGQLLTALLNRG
jgi:ActR/RegA family two-component response regulator